MIPQLIPRAVECANIGETTREATMEREHDDRPVDGGNPVIAPMVRHHNDGTYQAVVRVMNQPVWEGPVFDRELLAREAVKEHLRKVLAPLVNPKS